ncbi:MAG TPA: sigma-54 dependent transcriptional regulator [Gemmataceae bacterium]|nr:sigma-54 dependent transcriptional regulator [Gemmataceae bacterium]
MLAIAMDNADHEPLRVLVIDDNPAHAEVVAEGLERVGYVCSIATSGTQGAGMIAEEDFDVIITDMRMSGVDGLAIVRKAKQTQPEAEVIVITGFDDNIGEAIKLGAAHYLPKPVNLDVLRTIVDKSAQGLLQARAVRELRRQLDEKFGFEGVIGNSPKMQEVINRLKQLAPTATTVLILGENGTGKELAARALHFNSPRKNKPFVAMNCTAMNENLLDDELFGHVPGAYTGADKPRQGRFEHAHGGTLFLDEVGDMPLNLQAKLLRVLENGEIMRIGSNEPIKVDVRLISATNQDIESMVAEGRFRRDLYHRLRVGIVRMPPLRDRSIDIPLLAEHFRKEFNRKHGKNVQRFSAEVERAFKSFSWPGNVRELRNLIESMVVQDHDGVLDFDDMDESEPLRQLKKGVVGDITMGADQLIGRPLSEVERHYVEKTLDLTNQNRTEAARLLGIGERTLYRMIQDWKLQDRIKHALGETNGNLDAAAASLRLKPAALERKMKKLGLKAGG